MIFQVQSREKLLSSCVLSIVFFSGSSMIAMAQSTSAPSVFEGIYNEEQAIQGQALYYQYCLNCHGEDMGGVDKAPPLAGPQFASTWNNAPLEALVGRIQTMPPDKPGDLSREENVEILSYLLWYNGLPLGESPLVIEAAVLSQIQFQSGQAGQ